MWLCQCPMLLPSVQGPLRRGAFGFSTMFTGPKDGPQEISSARNASRKSKKNSRELTPRTVTLPLRRLKRVGLDDDRFVVPLLPMIKMERQRTA